MKEGKLELSVGVFVLAGLLALGWLSIKLARMEFVGGNHIPIWANFSSVSGLKTGANVEIAGVSVGRVDQIALDLGDYEAKVRLLIQPGVPIQDDAIASIRTKGLIGDRYISISPGGSNTLLQENGTIVQTEPAINFEELISQFVHGSI
ncbi:MAG: outer membrane lipid asymmetry maintenance protein MlaD [Magnetococcales bacterium]|nr:outer membrane lipid asymmetry maintenance protein MlaD [Magnetococcales bacterium]MBF0151169.1 outer membrane lipid asymmetry maintenance protein MlaD [Magnetococcales bacterium]MBF0174631.1 outer membrane lipid asymmetry maintenance protein MlaD [Magnetococcales bacterium]MBF0348675.1 outer membrane lipid asymmetry maintenance protein MlaD [Magnetococcales bacterium]MBF0632651.1 outer membrane lipid asymmetry maintenance protein MlaD [Magnetococcales bacterium]